MPYRRPGDAAARAAAIELLRAHGYDVVDVVLRAQLRSMISMQDDPFSVTHLRVVPAADPAAAVDFVRHEA